MPKQTIYDIGGAEWPQVDHSTVIDNAPIEPSEDSLGWSELLRMRAEGDDEFEPETVTYLQRDIRTSDWNQGLKAADMIYVRQVLRYLEDEVGVGMDDALDRDKYIVFALQLESIASKGCKIELFDHWAALEPIVKYFDRLGSGITIEQINMTDEDYPSEWLVTIQL